MKKILMAVGVAAITVGVQAASFNWTSTGTSTGKTINSSAGTALYSASTPYTLYLFEATALSQDTLLSGLRGGASITDYASIASQTLGSNSQIAAQAFSYGEAEKDYNFYFAVINGDEVFLSASKGASGQFADTVNVSFSGIGNATKSVFSDATATFADKGSGWYTASVPEPTSGLLLLLGMAGLALKRKKA